MQIDSIYILIICFVFLFGLAVLFEKSGEIQRDIRSLKSGLTYTKADVEYLKEEHKIIARFFESSQEKQST